MAADASITHTRQNDKDQEHDAQPKGTAMHPLWIDPASNKASLQITTTTAKQLRGATAADCITEHSRGTTQLVLVIAPLLSSLGWSLKLFVKGPFPRPIGATKVATPTALAGRSRNGRGNWTSWS